MRNVIAARLLALYGAPEDPTAFERYYRETHVPLAKKMPGLRSYTINAGPIGTPSGKAPYFLAAILDFDSMEALGAAFASPEGKAAAADTANFATGGVTMLTYETESV